MKRFYLLFLISILSLNLFCQVHWTKHPDNPVLTPGSPGEWDEDGVLINSVIYYDSTYYMWYSGGTFEDTMRIGHATSPDGVNWTKNPNNPVLEEGTAGEWDDRIVGEPNVLVIDSIFHMWYTGHSGSNHNAAYRIGHATSPDGIDWTKNTNNPVIDQGPPGSWDDVWAGAGKTVYADGTFHLWYDGFDGTGENIQTGHATSPDGVTWTKDLNNPVLTAGDWDSPRVAPGSVIFDGSTYQMWYNGGSLHSLKIGYATSVDGWQWERYGQPVLRNGPPGSWDSGVTYGATVLFDSTEYKYKMWYSGEGNENIYFIGYAESDTCSDIIRPELLAEDSLYRPDLIDVTSTENGMIYLVPYANYYTLDAIREATIDSVAAIASTPVQISLVGQPEGKLRLYARDNRNNISNFHQFYIDLGVGTIESRVKSPVKIYPNPAASIVNIQTNKPGDYSIVVETLNGKEISSDRFNGNTHQLDFSSFQNGIYFITIRSEDFITTRKIIKL